MDIIKWPKSALYVTMTAIIAWSQYQSLVKKHLSLNTINYVVLAYTSFQLIENSWVDIRDHSICSIVSLRVGLTDSFTFNVIPERSSIPIGLDAPAPKNNTQSVCASQLKMMLYQ
jgi:hypothetical protein